MYSYSYYSDFDSLAGGAIAAIVIASVIGLAVCILAIVAGVKILKTIGKPGWHILVPFLGSYDIFEAAWGPSPAFLFLVFLFIPIAPIVVSIMEMLKLARAFGKDTGFGVGLIFLPLIFMMILAFGKAEYIGPDGVPANAPAAGYPQYGQPQYGQAQYQAPQYDPYQQQQYQDPQYGQYQQPQYQDPQYPQQPPYGQA